MIFRNSGRKTTDELIDEFCDATNPVTAGELSRMIEGRLKNNADEREYEQPKDYVEPNTKPWWSR